MNHTIAQIKQLFNVKSIAYSTTLDNLAEGQFGIFADGVTTSVATGVTFATLPNKFRIFSKVGGKLYYSAEVIDKTKITNSIKKPYTAPVTQALSTTITAGSNIKSAVVKINIDEQSLLQRDGLTWTASDFVVEVADFDLAGYQDPGEYFPVYENNVVTKALVDKIVAIKSPFYTAEAAIAQADVTSGGTAASITGSAATAVGTLKYTTDAGNAIYQANGTTWAIVGAMYAGLTTGGVITDTTTYVAATKTVNTDGSTANDGKYLNLVIRAVAQPAGIYRDLEVNYVYPRGVKLAPVVTLNTGASATSNVTVLPAFTQTTAMTYEVGAGYDLRAMEYESMSLYTNLNGYNRLSDGIAAPGLVYQFENSKNYNTISLEFTTDKVERNAGDKRLFGVILGIEQTTPYNELVTAFGL